MNTKQYKDGIRDAVRQIEAILDEAERTHTIVFVYSDIRNKVNELKKQL